MNLVDVLVLVVIVLSAAAGFSRGLVREVLGLAAWGGAGVLAWRYAPGLVGTVHQYINDPGFADAVAYGVVFVAGLAVFSIVATVVSRFTRDSVLGGVDRSLGVLFGLARGAVVVAATYVVVGAWLMPPSDWPLKVQQARSLPLIYQGAAWAAERLPPADRPRVAPPPGLRQTTAAELLRATPAGRATGPAPLRD